MSTAPRMTAEDVERGYNNRAAVPDHPYWIEQFAVRSRQATERLCPAIDVRYGAGANETLDLFVPAVPARGTLVFIHGGYWRSFDKREHAFVAPAFVAAGIAVAVVNYGLCPVVTIATIVEQCRRAIEFIVRDGAALGAPPPVVVAGHSAGGHLAAMMEATDWRMRGFEKPPLAGAVTLSGLHELAPLVLSSYNADLKLDDAEALRMSPAALSSTSRIPLVIAVGGEETSEYHRQARVLFEARGAARVATGAPMVIARRHHFNVVLDYADPSSALTRATLALFERASAPAGR